MSKPPACSQMQPTVRQRGSVRCPPSFPSSAELMGAIFLSLSLSWARGMEAEVGGEAAEWEAKFPS